MAQNDILEGLSVDSILADVKAREDGENMKLWSMAEIDALLGEDAPSGEKKTPKTAEPTRKHIEKAASQPQKNVPAKEPAESIEKVAPATATESYFTKKPPKAEAKQENVASEVPEKRPTKPETVKPAKPAEHLPKEEACEPKPILEGTTPQTEKIEATEPQKTEPAAVQGQISIEKTRLFNEVEAHAVHKADMERHIGNRAIHTATPASERGKKYGGMEHDTNRARFFNRPKQELEKTRDHRELLSQLPPQTIEKPGVIVRNAPDKTQVVDGLQAIPTLVTPEEELRTQQEQATRVQEGNLHQTVFDQPEAEDDTLENQIRLAGFEEEPQVEIVDEEEAEQDLYERRYKKAQRFKLFPGLHPEDEEPEESEDEDEAENEELDEEIYEDEEPVDDEIQTKKQRKAALKARKKERKNAQRAQMKPQILREFYGPKDRKAVEEIFLAEKRGAVVRLTISIILTVATILSTLLIRFTGQFDWLGGNPGIYTASSLVFLAILGFMSLGTFKVGFSMLRYHHMTAEFGLFLVLLFGLLQTGVAFAYPQELVRVPLYTPVAAFSFTLYYLSKVQRRKADLANFAFVAENPKDFYAVQRIEDEETAFEIGRGLLLEDPDIRYSEKIAFPERFVEVSKEEDPAQNIFDTVIPILLLAGGVIGAITGFLFRSVFFGISAFSVTVLAGMPSAALLGSTSVFSGINKHLREKNAMLSSFSAAEDALLTNAVVVDAADLFNTAACRLSGMKLYHKMRVDEALLYTAAMVIQSGGTLAQVFDGVILGKHDILPQVESLAYEERLGCSGWIYNQRVLVGSRDLLQKHNVALPPVEEERRFRKENGDILYLAVEGKVAALFVVSYASNEKTAAYLQRLEKYGVNILVRTSDPNITEGLVEQKFRLPHNLVKMINPVAGDMFRDLVTETPRKVPCGILHRAAPIEGLHALLSAFVLDEKYRLSEILLYIGTGLSIVLMAIFSFFSGLSQAGAAEVVFFQFLWTLLVTQIPKIKKN